MSTGVGAGAPDAGAGVGCAAGVGESAPNARAAATTPATRTAPARREKARIAPLGAPGRSVQPGGRAGRRLSRSRTAARPFVSPGRRFDERPGGAQSAGGAVIGGGQDAPSTLAARIVADPGGG